MASRNAGRSWLCLASSLSLVVIGGCGSSPAPADTGSGGDAATADDAGGRDAAGGADASVVDTGSADANVVDANAHDTGSTTGVPAFRNPHPEIADADLAQQALRILGAPEAGATTIYCNECHTLTRSRIRYWRALSDAAMSECLTDLGVSSDASAAAMLTCLQSPTTGAYGAPRLGIWATAARLPWFRYVFEHGTTGDWMANHAMFADDAGMPKPSAISPTPLTQADFDIVAEWFLRGVPAVDTVLPAESLPTGCLPGVSAEVGAHVARMQTMGWGARNAADGMLMQGCAGATTTADCFATEPLARDTAYGATWETVPAGVPGAHLRVLFTTAYHSSYWTRSSADGRFVSHGATSGARLRFIDLQRGVVIDGSALYDPTFFPDNSGFIVQGSRGARVCEMSALTTGMPTALTFTEPGCGSGGSIGLYEHAGTSLDGADYWAISGSNVYDPATMPTLSDPRADFVSSARSTLYLMTNAGTSFAVGGTRSFGHPYEGDAVVSPSLRLIVNRGSGPGDRQLAFILRALDVTGSGSSLSVSSHEIGRYCASGGKPSFSFDERFIVYHHYLGDADAVELGYTGPSDPAFAPYGTRGGANVYLIDLLTGVRTRVTNMGPGQYALFPHFRSDGWIYFLVRSDDGSPERIVASDAAVLY